jgi:hypothetical protein
MGKSMAMPPPSVREQNGGIQVEAPQRLQGDIPGQFGRPHQVQETVLFAQSAVFGQVTPGLPHYPDRRSVNRPASAGVKKAFSGRHR